MTKNSLSNVKCSYLAAKYWEVQIEGKSKSFDKSCSIHEVSMEENNMQRIQTT